MSTLIFGNALGCQATEGLTENNVIAYISNYKNRNGEAVMQRKEDEYGINSTNQPRIL